MSLPTSLVVALLAALPLAACTSDRRAADASTDATTPPVDSGTGMCIADDLPCAPPDDVCVGDCQGRTCCSGLCADDTCVPRNLTFGTMCRDRCGGEAAGTWRVVGGCLPSACEGGFGAIAQPTLMVAADSSDSVQLGYDTHCGGYINTGGGPTISGLWDPDVTTIGGFAYCVDGDSLFIRVRDYDTLPGLVVELARM